MGEERCQPCKEAGQPNVLAHYKGVSKGMSATGHAVPPMCFDHRNGRKPQWLKDREQEAQPVLRNHAVTGRPRMELKIEPPARVEEALRLSGLSTNEKPKEQAQELKELVRSDVETDLGMVVCLKQVSPQCEKKVSAAKVRQICSECWSFMHMNGKKAKPLAGTPVEKPAKPLDITSTGQVQSVGDHGQAELYQMPDETLEAMLEQVWESQDERIVVAVMQECFSDLPRSVQVRLVQTALQERKSRLPQPTSRTNGDTDRPDMAFDAPGVRGPSVRQAEREKAAH